MIYMRLISRFEGLHPGMTKIVALQVSVWISVYLASPLVEKARYMTNWIKKRMQKGKAYEKQHGSIETMSGVLKCY